MNKKFDWLIDWLIQHVKIMHLSQLTFPIITYHLYFIIVNIDFFWLLILRLFSGQRAKRRKAKTFCVRRTVNSAAGTWRFKYSLQTTTQKSIIFPTGQMAGVTCSFAFAGNPGNRQRHASADHNYDTTSSSTFTHQERQTSTGRAKSWTSNQRKSSRT